ncbi:MAG TPA: site-specific integrase, partial [Cyclobacteriaceae bacterium]|nr:site-specific integrase [Cyclobacteriaceae bacterium]
QKNSVRGTWKGFRTVRGRLERYEQHTNEALYFESITFEWAEKFKEFAKKIDLDPNTLKKTFEDLGTFLNYYYSDQEKLGFTLTDDFRDVNKFRKVAGTHSSDPTPLYQDEIEAVMKFKPSKPIEFEIIVKGEKVKETITVEAQYKVKRLFLLSCFTGLRFSDITKLKKGNIQGNTIVIRARKTDRNESAKNLNIPLFKYAKDILEEIDHNIRSITLTNQITNKYLKQILKQIGIDTMMIEYSYSLNAERTEENKPKYDLVSFHSGRDTFITNCLIAGIDITTVMSWSGHSKFETFKKYVSLSDNYLKIQHRKADKFFSQFKLLK